VSHTASLGGVYTASAGDEPAYMNLFSCIPAALPYRPQRTTPKARVYGTQIGVVVGPSGEEIFTDKYGRVKVQFPWDRQGAKDANSSCWVRVGTIWAGKQWGAIHIPRVGQEVIVAYEEGDPDQPIIVGSVYNAEQMPPYALPDNRTQSGIKSRSTLGGEPANFNELRFEDKKGSEHIYFHAEKDFHRVVENNDRHEVGFEKTDQGDQIVHIHNDQWLYVGQPTDKGDNPSTGVQHTEVWNRREVFVGVGKDKCADGDEIHEIWNNQALVVGKGNGQNPDGSQTVTIYNNRTTTVKTGNETLEVQQGNRTVNVGTGNDTHEIKTGNRGVTIDMGNDTLTIKMGNQTTKLNLGASSTEAMQSITLKVGQSSIVVDQMGVTIKGMMIQIEGQVMTEVKGLMTQLSGDAMTTVKGGITMIN
jgi:type VI secretion system secreted protein VgrG